LGGVTEKSVKTADHLYTFLLNLNTYFSRGIRERHRTYERLLEFNSAKMVLKRVAAWKENGVMLTTLFAPQVGIVYNVAFKKPMERKQKRGKVHQKLKNQLNTLISQLREISN